MSEAEPRLACAERIPACVPVWPHSLSLPDSMASSVFMFWQLASAGSSALHRYCSSAATFDLIPLCCTLLLHPWLPSPHAPSQTPLMFSVKARRRRPRRLCNSSLIMTLAYKYAALKFLSTLHLVFFFSLKFQMVFNHMHLMHTGVYLNTKMSVWPQTITNVEMLKPPCGQAPQQCCTFHYLFFFMCGRSLGPPPGVWLTRGLCVCDRAAVSVLLILTYNKTTAVCMGMIRGWLDSLQKRELLNPR